MNGSRRRFVATGGALMLAGTLAPRAGRAQGIAYPDKPVRMFVPYPPGAATDTLGRFAAEVYTKAYGQSFIVENRSGGGTVIGTRAVATAPADGYTIGMVDTAFVINPGLLGSRLQYDTLKDFAPISLLATAPFVMVVHPSVKATDMASFVALAKAEPGALSFGSAGVGSAPHLAGEQLRQQAGIRIVHVPYRGGGTVFTDLLGGQIQFAFATVPTLLEHIKAGRLRAIAVTSPARVPSLPDVPTMAEAGYPNVDTAPLFGLVAPAGVPAPVIDKLGGTISSAAREGALHDKLASLGFQPVGSTPAEFAARIAADIAKWQGVIQRGGIKPE
ncbi:Bug family tripartite tricarboxylate transporter substrate binding protein [Bordetella genomosp. 11]|uniref:Twin-arginine translocation pathway signal protein n=1 Tax=Bordetella genomosp. 11 TaxID=1416808 RepID=A0A261UHQ1_9BORD|nr:tripartite tricarboxylate transporter substrate binding protein [Bordetella genomosp. 11]OZI60932.1 twin-arginine translocation pathway signal protein [Bordetella genomosp. 11]